jgi:hypothetical protein
LPYDGSTRYVKLEPTSKIKLKKLGKRRINDSPDKAVTVSVVRRGKRVSGMVLNGGMKRIVTRFTSSNSTTYAIASDGIWAVFK